MSGRSNSAAFITAPFEFDCGTVPPKWIDRNGHVNVTWYLVASERATARLYDELGLDEAMRARSGCGMFAAEHHIIYKSELRERDRMLVTALLLDCSDNGIHFLNCILRGRDRIVVAAVENLELHVNLRNRRVEPFLPQARVRLDAVLAAHAPVAANAAISRKIALRTRLTADRGRTGGNSIER